MAFEVVIAGGGIAGLEAMLALRDLAGERVGITVVSPEPDFLYKPLLVEEPFSAQPAERHDLTALTATLGADFVNQPVAGIDPGDRSIELGDGSRRSYDAAVVCVGARARPAYDGVTTFQGSGESLGLPELLAGAGSEPKRIAFVVPAATWPLPIYELAMMTQRHARQVGAKVSCAVYTPEEAPLILFGRSPSQAVSELLAARGIEVHPGATVTAEEDGRLVTMPGAVPLEADHVVALPLLEGPGIAGIPTDANGFIPIDEHARVKGCDDLYAAGDGTNFPIKQGGLGTQQADAAAEHIAARAGAPVEPRPFHPVLRGMLLAGDESLSLSHSLTGGEGEGRASLDYLWWPPHKVSGRYLATWLARESAHMEPLPPHSPLEVEVWLPKEWHLEPVALNPQAPPPSD